MRTKILVYGGLLVGVVILSVAVYFGYQFYYATFAATPEKALQEYFAALSRGDYSRMYDMTRGVPGSPQTAGEFAAQVRWLVKETPPRLAGVDLEQVGSKGNARYYRALLEDRDVRRLVPDGVDTGGGGRGGRRLEGQLPVCPAVLTRRDLTSPFSVRRRT